MCLSKCVSAIQVELTDFAPKKHAALYCSIAALMLMLHEHEQQYSSAVYCSMLMLNFIATTRAVSLQAALLHF